MTREGTCQSLQNRALSLDVDSEQWLYLYFTCYNYMFNTFLWAFSYKLTTVGIWEFSDGDKHPKTVRDAFYLHWGPSFCFYVTHDDLIKWKPFPCHWPFLRGIHRSPVNSPHKGQWRGALIFSLIWARINGWVNNREVGDLRRHRAYYAVTVMTFWVIFFNLKFCTREIKAQLVPVVFSGNSAPITELHLYDNSPLGNSQSSLPRDAMKDLVNLQRCWCSSSFLLCIYVTSTNFYEVFDNPTKCLVNHFIVKSLFLNKYQSCDFITRAFLKKKWKIQSALNCHKIVTEIQKLFLHNFSGYQGFLLTFCWLQNIASKWSTRWHELFPPLKGQNIVRHFFSITQALHLSAQ